jgi:hypothetical protein
MLMEDICYSRRRSADGGLATGGLLTNGDLASRFMHKDHGQGHTGTWTGTGTWT